MIEISEAGHGQRIVYLTAEEKELKRRLLEVKVIYATHYKNGQPIGYSWFLPNETLKRLKLTK